MTPVYLQDRTSLVGFIMVDYDEDQMRILLPDSDQRMPSARELLDGYKPDEIEIVVELNEEWLESCRTSDCGAIFVVPVWIVKGEADDLLHLPRELYQTVPEALGYCRKLAPRN